MRVERVCERKIEWQRGTQRERKGGGDKNERKNEIFIDRGKKMMIGFEFLTDCS